MMESILLLIQKEIIYLIKSLKSTWVMCLLFLIGFPLVAPEMGIAAMAIVPYCLIYGVMAHEEKCQSEAMTLVLPVTRHDIVGAKYCLGILYGVLGMPIMLVSFKIRALMSPTPFVTSLEHQYMAIGVMLVGMAMLFVAIVVPLILKFGTIKMRYIIFILYFVIFAFAGAIQSIFEVAHIDLIHISGPIGVLLGIVGLLAIYGLSYKLSVRIYDKKEF